MIIKNYDEVAQQITDLLIEWEKECADYERDIYLYYDEDGDVRRCDIRAIPCTGEPTVFFGIYAQAWAEAVDVPETAKTGRLSLRVWGADFDETWEIEEAEDIYGRFRFYFYIPKDPAAKEALLWLGSIWRPQRTDISYEMTAYFYDENGALVAEVHDRSGGDLPA